MSRKRDFNPAALEKNFSKYLQPKLSSGSLFKTRVWQFQIFFPRWLIKSPEPERICTDDDQRALEELLQWDFGGYTSSKASVLGVGYRGAQFEKNSHREITVLASRWRGTMRYFQALRKELQECSGEEQILILRQELIVV